jgi:hypothetical protein
MSGPIDDAFMTDVRPTDPTARVELLERQTTQLNGNIRRLMNRLEDAEGQVETLRAENLGLRIQAKKDPKEPDVNNPPMYEGDQKTLETWITACNLKFAGQPSRFPGERQKLVFATSYLKGPPLSWINPALNKFLAAGPLEEVPAELKSFNAFTEALKALYGDPNLERNALTALDNLKQATTVANYISRFAIHSQHANLNDVALRHAFYKGLKSGIKDELATRDYTTFKELQTLATKLDARLRERALELKAEAPGVRPTSSAIPRAAVPVRPSTATPAIAIAPVARSFNRTPQIPIRPQVVSPAPAADGITPMELDNLRVGKLTPTEKERCLREGRCFRCREYGHVGASCPHYTTIAGIEINLAENDESQE